MGLTIEKDSKKNMTKQGKNAERRLCCSILEKITPVQQPLQPFQDYYALTPSASWHRTKSSTMPRTALISWDRTNKVSHKAN